MKHFFPMRKSEIIVLIYLLTFAVISFLPVWRTIEIGGMAVFGWLMAALMLTSPILTLLVLRRSGKSGIQRPSKDKKSVSRASESKLME